jgi:ABC-type uncharacterized transport system substrate-binding protein
MTASSKQRAVNSMRTGEKRMIRKFFVFACLLSTVLLLTDLPAEAQPIKVPRVGVLSGGSSTGQPLHDAFRQGLRELGYIDSQNIVIEYRYAEGKLDRLSNLAAELVHLKVDIIFAGVPGTAAAVAAKNATTTLPIVFANVSAPVATGLVVSLARPGGNVTGLSGLGPELYGKRFDLLNETLPKLSRLAVLQNSANPSIAFSLRELEMAAKAVGVQLQILETQTPNDFDKAFSVIAKGRTDALAVQNDPVFFAHRIRIAELAAKNRVPTIYGDKQYVEAGGLMSYGANILDLYRRAAIYVDKILKGAKPADLPVEQPRKFEFIINLKAAKQIGLTIPPNVLVRADRVIK